MDELDDRDMRGLYGSNAPAVEGDETWEAIRERVAARPSARPRRPRMRLAAICAAALVAVAAVSLGVYEAVDHLRAPRQLLILGGEDETPAASDAPITVVPLGGGEEVVLTGERAQVYREIQRAREGLAGGTLVYDPAAALAAIAGQVGVPYRSVDTTWPLWDSFPEDANALLDEYERSLFSAELTVYLMTDVSDEQTSALQAEIVAMPEVRSVVFVSKEAALERVKQLFADKPEVLENLTGNPLPANFEIRLVDSGQPASLVARLSALPGVDQVKDATDPAQQPYEFELSNLHFLFHPTDASTESTEASTSTTLEADSFRTVLHPYLNSYGSKTGVYADHLPTKVDPIVESVNYPDVVPAYRGELRPLPPTDIQFVAESGPGAITSYNWAGPGASDDLNGQELCSPEVARTTAEAFLKDHGLWESDLVFERTSWGSYQHSGGNDRTITSIWHVVAAQDVVYVVR